MIAENNLPSCNPNFEKICELIRQIHELCRQEGTFKARNPGGAELDVGKLQFVGVVANVEQGGMMDCIVANESMVPVMISIMIGRQKNKGLSCAVAEAVFKTAL